MVKFYSNQIKKITSLLQKIFLILFIYLTIIILFNKLTNQTSKLSNKNILQTNSYHQREILNELFEKLSSSSLPDKEKLVYFLKNILCITNGDFCIQNEKKESKPLFALFSEKLNSLLISLFTFQPASGFYWTYYHLYNNGFIPVAYAKPPTGVGFASLHLVFQLWKNLRDLSFLIIVLILVTIGFMIMFRSKINPQTVITVENSLPKIVIALILITFSYPIVGFLIDLTFISIPLIASLFKNLIPIQELNSVTTETIRGSFSSLIINWKNIGMYMIGIKTIIGGLIFQVINPNLQTFISIIIGTLVTFIAFIFIEPLHQFLLRLFDIQIFAVIANWNVGKAIVSLLIFIIAPILLTFFIAVATIFFMYFRIFFFFLSCIINLVLYIILSPVYLLFEAIPGRSTFSSWLKNIIGNLIVFPGFFFLVLTTQVLYNQLSQGESFLILPGLSTTGKHAAIMASLFGIYMWFLIPDLLKVLRQLVIGKEGIQLPVSPGLMFQTVGTTFSTLTGFANQLYYAKLGYEIISGSLKRKKPAEAGGVAGPDQKISQVQHLLQQVIELLGGKKS